MKVQFEDPFRYALNKKEEVTKKGQTEISDDVIIYHLLPPKGRNLPPLKLIDIPDFGDRDLENDEKIFEKIKELFKNKSDNKINAICFVLKSSRIKLSLSEEYIYNKVLKIFGNKFKENFLFLLTFCDGSIPQIKKSLESPNSLFKDVIPYIKKPYFYTFNFSAIFANNNGKEYQIEFNKAFWQLAMDISENFLNRIKQMNSKDFILTKEVIEALNSKEALSKIDSEKENFSFYIIEDYEILSFIFPVPAFNPKKMTKEIKDYLIYIPTARKIKNSEKIEKIPCFFKKNENSQNILIIFHCNGWDMFNIFEYFSDYGEKYNINLLIPEYPGYSIYDSPLSPEMCLKNSLIIYDFILNNIKNITEKNIYVLGRSLGTGPAIYLSAKRHPAATFLISPYTTFASVGNHNSEDYHYEVLSNVFRSIDYIGKINNPLLIIHGKDDDLINYQNSQKLYEKCKNDIIKDIKLIENMNHNYTKNFFSENIIPIIIEFSDKYCSSYKNEN